MIDPKKLYKLAVLFAAVLVSSCITFDEEPEVPVDPGKDPAESVDMTLKFVLPADATAGKTAWVAGDQIVVHGEYAADQVTVTLEAGDISADGKTATHEVKGLLPYVNEEYKSNLYASYPASAVDNLRHCFCYSKFSTTNAPLMAACNDDDTFRFKNICGMVRFIANGNFDSFTLSDTQSGAKKADIGYEFLQVKITDTEQNLNQYRGDPVKIIEVPFKSGESIVYIPAGVELPKGLSLKFRKDGAAVKAFNVLDPVSISAGSMLDLGDITASMQDYDDPLSDKIPDLGKNGTANCYIIEAPGVYKFMAVQGNTKAYVGDAATAEVLWETWNNGEDVAANSVVKSVLYSDDYIVLHTPDVLHAGNAVIAVKDAEGVILWSWHIWVPETKIGTGLYGGIFGAEAMSRNLGALIDAVAGSETEDSRSFGLSYQWGRKDPYPGPKAIKSSSPATVAGAEAEVAPGQISIEESIANPLLMGHINNGDWFNDEDNTRWSNTEKTVYDPCPPGWRVPKRDSTVPFWGSNLSTAEGWQADFTLGWFTIGNPVSVFPVCGYRDDYGVSSFTHVYDRALYWTAYASSAAKAYGEDIRYDTEKGALKQAVLTEAPKARAAFIRCVAE